MMKGNIFERFQKGYKVHKKSGCWIWLKNISTTGYGRMNFNYINYRSHRLSYLIYVGEIPEEMVICHTCDNKKCVNPNHLFLGTILDNVADRVKKNRTSQNENHYKCKLSNKQVIKIRKMKGSARELAEKFKVNTSTIYNIRKYKNRKGI